MSIARVAPAAPSTSSSTTSTYSTSSGTSPCPFPRATVYWKTPKKTSKPRDAWLSITSFVRWKYVDSQDGAPAAFSAFRGHECLALERLPGNAKWENVKAIVHPVNTKYGYAVCVPGVLSGNGGLSSIRRNVRVVFISDSKERRDACMDSIRIRVSPWQLLHRRMKDMLIDSTLSPDALRAIFLCVEQQSSSAELPQPLIGQSQEMENVRRFESAMEGANVLSAFAEAVATVVQKSAPLVKDTAENVADLAKCVSVVSSAFQVVALCASLAEMGFETKRGYEEWPRILALVKELRNATVENMVPVLHPDGHVNEFLVRNMFEVQEELVDILTVVEKEVMRSGTLQSVVRFFKSCELKQVEEKVKTLKRCVASVVQSGDVAKNSITLANVRKNVNRERKNLSSLCLRPRLTPYFLGREKELQNLKDILDQHGSVAIMQYGGVGKTQLMVAFAERSEKSGWVPGGCYWIRAHGNRVRMEESLASFTESLNGDPLSERDRRDISVVLGILKGILSSFIGRWMLCVDNADSSDVNEVVGELCSFAKEFCPNGWVLVTSRQGGRILWNGMVSEQRLKLKPLEVEQAMAVLFRWKEELLDVVVTNDLIMSKLMDLKREEPLEYKWLRKLAGDDKECGLGGLALALAQAGSFIHRHDFSFSEYASLYMKKRKCKDVLRLFPEVNDRGLDRRNQRMIWATWKSNVDALSEKARCVLFAFAMFDCVSVPQELVKGLDSSFSSDELTFAEIVHDELMDGASFLQENKVGGHVTFETHRLIREFILLETKSDDDHCRDALRRAARIALKVMKSTGETMRCERFRKLLPHVSSLLLFVSNDQFSLGTSIPIPSVFFYLFLICVRDLREVGWYADATSLCSGWLRLLRNVYGEKRDNRHVMNALRLVASISMRNGAHAEAKELLLEYLDISRRLHGNESDHIDFAYSFRELGEVARKKSQLNVAESWHRKSLEMLFRLYGDGVDCEDIAFAMNRQGRIQYELGSLAEAERWSLRSVDMFRRIHGKDADSKHISNSFNILGLVFREKGNLDEAERYFLLSVEMERRMYGPDADTSHISIFLLNLGRIADSRGHHDQAANWYRQCYEMRLRIFGEGVDHERILSILYAMAKNEYVRGAVQEGLDKLKECIEMERRLYGDDWPGVKEHVLELEKWRGQRPESCNDSGAC